MAKEAIELYLESLEEHGEEIPTEDDVFYSQVNIDAAKTRSPYA